MNPHAVSPWFRRLFPAIAALVLIAGCGRDLQNSASPVTSENASALNASESKQEGIAAPADLVTVSLDGQSLQFWPYTGAGFDGTPSDPINLVLTGKADPVAIRQALLNLDGDRTAFGMPDAYPFNARWSDANGDIQTTWSDGEGWVGSAIELQLGNYDPIRVHLRLFRTGKSFGEDGVWTLAAAHFEVLIPGTADHQVLSWEVAEQVVTADLVRTGLLAGAPVPTGMINQVPSFREIPDYIYNNLPAELIAVIQGPLPPVSGPVPIGNDGQAMMFHVAGSVPIVAGTTTHTMTFTYQIVMPKPMCSDGPFDFVLVSGPVDFTQSTTIGPDGSATVEASYRGHLDITPMDVTVNPPQPAGASYKGEVSEVQNTYIDAWRSQAMSLTKMIAPQVGGAEFKMIRLKVGTTGANSRTVSTKCLEPAS